MITHPSELTPHNNLVPYPFSATRPAPSDARQRVIWLTGLSGAGKSTIVDSDEVDVQRAVRMIDDWLLARG